MAGIGRGLLCGGGGRPSLRHIRTGKLYRLLQGKGFLIFIGGIAIYYYYKLSPGLIFIVIHFGGLQKGGMNYLLVELGKLSDQCDITVAKGLQHITKGGRKLMRGFVKNHCARFSANLCQVGTAAGLINR